MCGGRIGCRSRERGWMCGKMRTVEAVWADLHKQSGILKQGPKILILRLMTGKPDYGQ